VKAVNRETKRAVGGFSFTDSIIRTNAEIDSYVEKIVSSINNELLSGDLKLKWVRASKYIQFFLGTKKFLWFKPDQVEEYSRDKAAMLEKILLSNIECEGYNFDKTNSYYKNVWAL
jgi:hypothetical protein